MNDNWLLNLRGWTPEGRPIIRNKDGSFSTERTITVTEPGINYGMPTNIPTMFGGMSVSPEEAIQRIMRMNGFDPDTMNYMRSYTSIPEAESAAQTRSNNLNQLLNWVNSLK